MDRNQRERTLGGASPSGAWVQFSVFARGMVIDSEKIYVQSLFPLRVDIMLVCCLNYCYLAELRLIGVRVILNWTALVELRCFWSPSLLLRDVSAAQVDCVQSWLRKK